MAVGNLGVGAMPQPSAVMFARSSEGAAGGSSAIVDEGASDAWTRESRPRVLVADDSDTIRGWICGALAAENYELIEAPSGEEALVHLAAAPFDVVLLDLVMPGFIVSRSAGGSAASSGSSCSQSSC